MVPGIFLEAVLIGGMTTALALATDLQAGMIDRFRPTVPQPGFPTFKVYIPNRQRILVKRSRKFNRINFIRDRLVLVAYTAIFGSLAIHAFSGSFSCRPFFPADAWSVEMRDGMQRAILE